MKPFTPLAAFCLIATAAFAETNESLDQILATAKAANKPVVLEFTGSDWCPPCKMQDKQVFSTQTFKDFAAKDIVFVKLDFPRSREQAADVKARNRELAEKFSVDGFPTLVVLSSSGKELGREVGYSGGGVDSVIAWIKETAKL